VGVVRIRAFGSDLHFWENVYENVYNTSSVAQIGSVGVLGHEGRCTVRVELCMGQRRRGDVTLG
jgi:hypothetical protein